MAYTTKPVNVADMFTVPIRESVTSDEIAEIDKVTNLYRRFAEKLESNLPEGEFRDTAIRLLHESLPHAAAAIGGSKEDVTGKDWSL